MEQLTLVFTIPADEEPHGLCQSAEQQWLNYSGWAGRSTPRVLYVDADWCKVVQKTYYGARSLLIIDSTNSSLIGMLVEQGDTSRRYARPMKSEIFAQVQEKLGIPRT